MGISQESNNCRDFKLHVDPEYGNCYTFNFNDSVELKNSRAGPMYGELLDPPMSIAIFGSDRLIYDSGLRLLLDVHQDDYMPTTEAAGVRIVVHEQVYSVSLAENSEEILREAFGVPRSSRERHTPSTST